MLVFLSGLPPTPTRVSDTNTVSHTELNTTWSTNRKEILFEAEKKIPVFSMRKKRSFHLEYKKDSR